MEENGGQSGIRTRDTLSRIHTFQACAFNHSATCPFAVTPAVDPVDLKALPLFFSGRSRPGRNARGANQRTGGIYTDELGRINRFLTVF